MSRILGHGWASAVTAIALTLLGCGGGADGESNEAFVANGGGGSAGMPFGGAAGYVPGAGGGYVPPLGAGGSFTPPPGAGGAPFTTGGAPPFTTGGAPPFNTGGAPTLETGGSPGAGGGGVGGQGTGTCCSDGNCLCHGSDPSEQSATAKGTYAVEQYTSGFTTRPGFGAGTVYYPTDAEPPLAGVVVCPGWTAVQSSIAGWGPFLASHGIVVMTIDTLTTGDSVAQRADELMAALNALKGETSRSGSPLSGKLDPARYGLMGWSMGGGGTWIAAGKHPELKTSISLAGHILSGGGATVANGTTVPSFMFVGATDTAILGGGGQSQGIYDAIPAATPKILYQIASLGHNVGNNPSNNSGAVGRYGLSWQKVFLEGDTRYRQFLLVPGPGNNEWRSTLQ